MGLNFYIKSENLFCVAKKQSIGCEFEKKKKKKSSLIIWLNYSFVRPNDRNKLNILSLTGQRQNSIKIAHTNNIEEYYLLVTAWVKITVQHQLILIDHRSNYIFICFFIFILSFSVECITICWDFTNIVIALFSLLPRNVSDHCAKKKSLNTTMPFSYFSFLLLWFFCYYFHLLPATS